MRKVIVMNRKEVAAPQPQVTAFLLIDDATSQEICSAHITSVKRDTKTGAILPNRMEIRMPAQKMSMSLTLGSVTVNGKIAETAFVRQPITGTEAVNLATWNLQRTGGFK